MRYKNEIITILLLLSLTYSETFTQFYYSNRHYIMNNSTPSATFFLDTLRIKDVPFIKQLDYRDSCYEAVVQHQDFLIDKYAFILSCIKKRPHNLSMTNSDTVAVKGAITILSLNYNRYKKIIDEYIDILKYNTYRPTLISLRNDLVKTVESSNLPDSLKNDLLSFVPLADTLSNKILKNKSISPFTRARLTEEQHLLDSLMNEYNSMPFKNTGDLRAYKRKVLFMRELSTIDNDIVKNFTVEHFNDSVFYTTRNNCISETIKYPIIQQWSTYTKDTLFHEELFKLRRDPLRKHRYWDYQPEYIRNCIVWFKEHGFGEPTLQYEKTVSVIKGKCNTK